MKKEIEPIQKLEQERARLSNIIGQRESLVGKIGTDKVWIGSSSEGTLDKVLVGSSFEATLKVGQVRKNTRDSVVRLNSRLEGVNNQIHEFHAEEDAREHIAELNLRRNQLATMSEMVAEGNLTEDELRKHQQDFEELVKLPQTNPLLQKGLERIRQEEEKKKEAETTKPAETKPLIEILPFGMVKLPNSTVVDRRFAELLISLAGTSEDKRKTTDEIGRELYPEAEARAAFSNAYGLIERARTRLIGNGVELVTIEPDRIGKRHVEKASHFLREERPAQVVEQELPKEVETTTIDGQAIIVEAPRAVSLSKVDAFIQELPEETRPLFAEVRDSTDFGYARDIVGSFVGTNPEDIKQLGAQVAGYLFETLAYLHLRKKFSEQNKILLSPQETFEVYYQLHPQRRELSGEYKLQRGIEGISVPDGMLLTVLRNGNRGVRVDGVLEYRLGIRDDSETTDKLARYPSLFGENMSLLKDARSPESNMIRQYLLSRYPNFPRNILVNPNAEAFLAVPLGAKIPAAPAGVKEIYIPVPAVTFRHFVNALMFEIQDNKLT